MKTKLKRSKPGRERVIPSTVTVMPLLSQLAGKHARFMACAEIGARRFTISGAGKRRACRFGKNPRKAVAAAMHAAATKIGARSGAFAGLKRKSKRRRRR